MIAIFTAPTTTIRADARARSALASVVVLCAALSVCSANATIQVCTTGGADCLQRQASVTGPSADTVVRASAILLAADQSQGGAAPVLRDKHPGLGGVIDRSVPRPASAAASSPEANLTQFNRLPEGSALTGPTVAKSPAALPDPNGGPVLYTIVERAPQQVRPVGYTQPLAPTAGARGKPSAKRYCTVTEVLRSTSAQSCR